MNPYMCGTRKADKTAGGARKGGLWVQGGRSSPGHAGRARAAYEEQLRNGTLPPKDRGIMVRGRREWTAEGPSWRIDAKVNH